jgi:hypothetical protein
MYAEPPLSQALTVLKFVRGLSFLSQVKTGEAPLASVVFPGHEHEGLQQSQYRVVVPVPDAADADWRKKGKSANSAFVGRDTILTDKYRCLKVVRLLSGKQK